jgi:hypothetical protein
MLILPVFYIFQPTKKFIRSHVSIKQLTVVFRDAEELLEQRFESLL